MPENRFEIGVSCAPESVERTVVMSSCVPHEKVVTSFRGYAGRILATPPGVDLVGVRLHRVRDGAEAVRAVGRDQVHPVDRVAGDDIRHAVGLRGGAAPRGRRGRPRAGAARVDLGGERASGEAGGAPGCPLRPPRRRPLTARNADERDRGERCGSRSRHRDANTTLQPLLRDADEERALTADRSVEPLDALAHPLRAPNDRPAVGTDERDVDDAARRERWR